MVYRGSFGALDGRPGLGRFNRIASQWWQMWLNRVKLEVPPQGVDFPARLIVMKSEGVNVILGEDWLDRHNGVVYCSKKTVVLTSPTGEKIEVVTSLPRSETASMDQPTVNAAEVRSVESIPVVAEFPDVFPEELPGMPPERDVEFSIELLPGTAPIAKRAYRIAGMHMEELKK